MTLSNQLAPVLTLAKRKWQEVVPGWLQPEANPPGYWWDTRFYPKGNKRATHVPIHPDAAALIVTGALSKWLAGQGIAVVYIPGDTEVGPADGWFKLTANMGVGIDRLDATDFLSALIAAATARLGEMPDAAAADSATASKEPPQ